MKRKDGDAGRFGSGAGKVAECLPEPGGAGAGDRDQGAQMLIWCGDFDRDDMIRAEGWADLYGKSHPIPGRKADRVPKLAQGVERTNSAIGRHVEKQKAGRAPTRDLYRHNFARTIDSITTREGDSEVTCKL